jgi:CubicO group peptidase (beta-lactamase class C family)
MNDRELQELLDDTAERLAVVGAQLAIYDGQHQREFATGDRNLELGLPVTKDTVFQIGSTTKIFNAALIMSLVDAGKVDLDAPVREYVHDLRLADLNALQSVTLRQLLSMSAGLDNGPYYDYGRGDDALGRYVEVLGGIPQVFEPGSAYGYSNASSIVAGHAAARVTGQTWEDSLTKRIWAPLGLTQSLLFAEDLLLRPVALGYRKVDPGAQIRRTPNWCYPRSMAPTGGLTCCSAGDLVHLGRMFLDRGKSIWGVQVLSEAAIESMQCPHIKLPARMLADEWCLGPYRKRWDNNILHGHSGTNLSGSSTLLWCREKNIAIATVANVPDQGYPLTDAIFDIVFPGLFGIAKPKSVKPEDLQPVRTDLSPYVGRFEAFGVVVHLAAANERLAMKLVNSVTGEIVVSESELVPLGDGRFLPRNPAISGNRNWDLAFWKGDASGRMSHMLLGLFPLRRTR